MTDVACACGGVVLRLDGPPILASACHCNSCREAAARLDAPIIEANGATRMTLQRKDRAQVVEGGGELPAQTGRIDEADHRDVLREPDVAGDPRRSLDQRLCSSLAERNSA